MADSSLVTKVNHFYNGWTAIPGATSAVYAPKEADLNRCLRARATYSDNLSVDDQQAEGVSEVPVGRHSSADPPEPEAGFVNAAPVFPDQDPLTEGGASLVR